ncbi:phosphoribosyl-ATP pyrophosphatase /phosphoribosyl-AMP cyclohydrolase [Carnobacterium iners]|uniref:Histidine biosynthesis bifunctional protein HisIE n=1 Tax=Carnobacterium iners TaxID=1073423 RepID=A0A1X7MYP9_9LACT|nr:bifunctional phosphoribosyl-AMP cyclohydrolase/phosphoribosyl-ATP diphosphatase HisIE [Carnobacterium iners]SEK17818.1 phosphoribosyl-ATP pyrophosphatase /phosphoribosyl-AMP cyclohydrolase [Carnobacterium iners]SMH29210.1 phosphoribosyl-ATP pyrophosphatase /phosphoribosyl-AMP cyclohydrolase [Carnobacterium iners]
MEIKYDANGLVPAIAQDIATGEVLMLAYMNEETVKLTLETNIAHYYSRSRKEIWKKGATSGNSQEVKGFYYDCDGDTILIKVSQTGVACHTGTYSCFTNELKSSTANKNTIGDLYKVVLDRKLNPVEGSYTAYLFDEGVDKILKKVGEESAEVIIGAKNNKEELVYEASDLVYHLLVLLVNEGVPLGSLYEELAKRMK